MSNILNHNKNNLDLRISKSDYWDVQLHKGQKGGNLSVGRQDECLSAYIDTTFSGCVDNDGEGNIQLISLNDYAWDESVNNGVNLEHIGWTGIDNGLIKYDKDNISEDEFKEIYYNSILSLEAEDYRLYLSNVEGNNKLYSYNTEIVESDGINVVKLDGGFYQGFFQSWKGCNYKVLPTKLGEGWTMEFVLKMKNFDNEHELPTLNDIYPQNKGIFFYIGTRAENKWWKLYQTGEMEYMKDKKTKTDNKFITYHRAAQGLRAGMGLDEETETEVKIDKHKDLGNYFIVMNRAKGGYTAKDVIGMDSDKSYDYNILQDLYKNALAFQLNEDGSVGYKYLIKDCDSENGYKVDGETSYKGMVDMNEWVMITVRVVPVVKYGTESFNYNDNMDYMRLMFYVNGNLVLRSKTLPTLLLRVLNDDSEKQESVPYNISIGGGTQGLCDVVYGLDSTPEDMMYLEKNFGGSFSGYFKSFRFHDCNLDYQKIMKNYRIDFDKDTEDDKRVMRMFYGTITFDGKPSENELTDEQIISLKSVPVTKKTINITVPVGTRRVVIAYPDNISDIKQIIDTNVYNFNIINSFAPSKENIEKRQLSTINPNPYVKYNIYKLDFAQENKKENIYIIKF